MSPKPRQVISLSSSLARAFAVVSFMLLIHVILLALKKTCIKASGKCSEISHVSVMLPVAFTSSVIMILKNKNQCAATYFKVTIEYTGLCVQ